MLKQVASILLKIFFFTFFYETTLFLCILNWCVNLALTFRKFGILVVSFNFLYASNAFYF